jgi:hypothetical protein
MYYPKFCSNCIREQRLPGEYKRLWTERRNNLDRKRKYKFDKGSQRLFPGDDIGEDILEIAPQASDPGNPNATYPVF